MLTKVIIPMLLVHKVDPVLFKPLYFMLGVIGVMLLVDIAAWIISQFRKDFKFFLSEFEEEGHINPYQYVILLIVILILLGVAFYMMNRK